MNDMNDIPSVHPFLEVAKKFIQEVPTHDPAMEEFKQDASMAILACIAMLSPKMVRFPCPNAHLRIIPGKYLTLKEEDR